MTNTIEVANLANSMEFARIFNEVTNSTEFLISALAARLVILNPVETF